jgi:hypothetical protein
VNGLDIFSLLMPSAEKWCEAPCLMYTMIDDEHVVAVGVRVSCRCDDAS